jgi:hypothetical protein
MRPTPVSRLPLFVRLLPLLILAVPTSAAWADDTASPPKTPPVTDERAHLIAAAREIMGAQTYCALVTLDESDPRVVVYYANHAEAIGYVALHGRAVLVDDMQEILKRKRAYWDQAFPGLKNLVLIKVVPERIDVLNYKAGTKPNPETWRPPSIDFGPAEP